MGGAELKIGRSLRIVSYKIFVGGGCIDSHTTRTEVIMEMKKVLAGWSKICPGCNIGLKYPDSFIGKKVRNHWKKVASLITPTLRCMKAMSLRRRKVKKNPTIRELPAGLFV